MSLTSFLDAPAVKARFSTEFPVPVPRPQFKNWQMLAPPISSRSSVIGTAFDYVFRFHLRRLHPATQHENWIANGSLGYLESTLLDAAKEIIGTAFKRYKQFLSGGILSDELLQSAILLAQLDGVFRSGGMLPPSGEFIVLPDDIKDLRQLSAICSWQQWCNARKCELNPSFGNAIILVGGADGDFWIDETLYEIKTVRSFGAFKSHYHQLIGYSALNFLSCGPPIEELAIYFSRFAQTVRWPAPDWKEECYIPFLCWFCRASGERFGGAFMLEDLVQAMPEDLPLCVPLMTLARELNVKDD